MSDHLKKITDRARKIRAKKPSMKWTDAVKQASIELGMTKAKTPGRKPGAVIYARQSKTKTGKTRTKVYARAKPVKKTKSTPGANMEAFSKPRKPKPTPKRGRSSSYVTPTGKVYTKTKTGRKKIVGNPLLYTYLASKVITNKNQSSVKGLSYKNGKPMLSLSGYGMHQEKILIGSTATQCSRYRKIFKTSAKNIGQLEQVYSVPEVKVELVGRKAVKNTYQIKNSSGSADLIRTYINDKMPGLLQTRECFGALYLNMQNRVLAVYLDSVGGQVSVAMDAQYIMLVGLKLACKGVIIFHNHPSGSMQPSRQDEEVTQDLKKGLASLQIRLLDHIILSGTDNDYFSFMDNGLIR